MMCTNEECHMLQMILILYKFKYKTLYLFKVMFKDLNVCESGWFHVITRRHFLISVSLFFFFFPKSPKVMETKQTWHVPLLQNPQLGRVSVSEP